MAAPLKKAAATAPPQAEAFYAESLRLLKKSHIPFLVAGTFAVSAYTGINRPTKDLDLFCKAGDYPRILTYFQKLGYVTEIEDESGRASCRERGCQYV